MPSLAELEIQIGVEPYPGDTETAEVFFESITLLNEDDLGWNLELNGWTPARAGKTTTFGQGASNENLVSVTTEAVDETLKLTLRGASANDVRKEIGRLQRWLDMAENFQLQPAQFLPVQLMVREQIGDLMCYPHYALILSGSIASTEPDRHDGSGAGHYYSSVTLNIKREPLYRIDVPYGVHPQKYATEAGGGTWGSGGTFYSLGLSTSLPNVTEFNSSATTDRDYPTTKPYIAINGEDIIGDAPALVYIETLYPENPDTNSFDADTFYFFKRTFPEFIPARGSGATPPQLGKVFSINAGDGSGGSLTITSAGIFNAGGTRTTRRFSSSGSVVWNQNMRLKTNMLSGTHMVFVRYFYSSGAATEALAELNFDERGVGEYTTPSVTLPFRGNNFVETIYVDTVTLPLNTSVKQQIDGRGYQNQGFDDFASGERELDVSLNLSNITLADPIDILDVVFIPIDEAMVKIVTDDVIRFTSIFEPNDGVIYDNTYYLTRGEKRHSAQIRLLSNRVLVFEGHEMTLDPGRDVLIGSFHVNSVGNTDYHQDLMSLIVQIVPRSYQIGGWTPPQ